MITLPSMLCWAGNQVCTIILGFSHGHGEAAAVFSWFYTYCRETSTNITRTVKVMRFKKHAYEVVMLFRNKFENDLPSILILISPWLSHIV
jgi:hypothetical protein